MSASGGGPGDAGSGGPVPEAIELAEEAEGGGFRGQQSLGIQVLVGILGAGGIAVAIIVETGIGLVLEKRCSGRDSCRVVGRPKVLEGAPIGSEGHQHLGDGSVEIHVLDEAVPTRQSVQPIGRRRVVMFGRLGRTHGIGQPLEDLTECRYGIAAATEARHWGLQWSLPQWLTMADGRIGAS